MRRAARKDANQTAIVDALRQVGVTVVVVNSEGAPDLLCCGRSGEWVPIEVKVRKGKLTPLQAKLAAPATYPIARTVEQALQLFGIFYANGYQPITKGQSR
jgi:hypothetical protein